MSKITKFTFKDNNKETQNYFIDKILVWFEENRNSKSLVDDCGRRNQHKIQISTLRMYLDYFEKWSFTYDYSRDDFFKYLEKLTCWSKIEDNFGRNELSEQF